MKKYFPNFNLFLLIILFLQIISSIFRLYFEFLNIQIWHHFQENNPIKFQETQFSYLKIIIHRFIPILICLMGVLSTILILKQKKIGYLLSLIFWILFFINFIFIIPLNEMKQSIDYFYLFIILGIIISILIYLGTKIKQLYFKTV